MGSSDAHGVLGLQGNCELRRSVAKRFLWGLKALACHSGGEEGSSCRVVGVRSWYLLLSQEEMESVVWRS